jgi:N-acetylneuraminic acid mutarotase
MKKAVIMLSIGFLCLSTFSMFSPNVNASVTVMPTRLPDVRSFASAVWDGSNAYVFGGASLSGPSNQILKYNPASDTISVMSATLPDPLCDMPAVWTGGYAYVFGGYVAPLHTSNKIVRYDPSADTITVMGAVLPTYAYPVYSMSAIWDGNAAYLFGGYDGYAYFDHILKYDPVLDQITTMSARLPTGIKWMSAVWTGTYAYIFGGRTASGVTNQIVRYDPMADSVTVASGTLPESVIATSAVWTGSNAYIFGGRTMENVDSSSIFKYDPASDSCITVGENLPSPRAETCAIWDGQSAFIFGGSLPPSIFDEIVRFSPEAPFTVLISPASASLLIGQSATFTSTVSGGYAPYGYQWHLGGNPVSGATSNSWTFTPTTSGVYYVYLKVTDTLGNATQSETARIAVTPVPVGGYSIPIEGHTSAKPLTPYLALIAILSLGFIMIRRKTTKRVE